MGSCIRFQTVLVVVVVVVVVVVLLLVLETQQFRSHPADGKRPCGRERAGELGQS